MFTGPNALSVAKEGSTGPLTRKWRVFVLIKYKENLLLKKKKWILYHLVCHCVISISYIPSALTGYNPSTRYINILCHTTNYSNVFSTMTSKSKFVVEWSLPR